MLTTKIPGYLDYMMGLLLMVAPLIFKVPVGAASTILVVLGAGTIVYSLITDYELGLIKILSMKAHLSIDLIAGVLLIASPWIFNFAEEAIWLFIILGVVEIGASLLTQKQPSYEKASRTYRFS